MKSSLYVDRKMWIYPSDFHKSRMRPHFCPFWLTLSHVLIIIITSAASRYPSWSVKNKVSPTTNLEEALAALTGAHSVVLACCVIAANRAQPLRTQGYSAGAWRRLVVHEVVTELERVRKPHSVLLPERGGAQNPGAAQRLVRPGCVQVHGQVERPVKFHLAGGEALLLRVFERKKREPGESVFPVRRG